MDKLCGRYIKKRSSLVVAYRGKEWRIIIQSSRNPSFYNYSTRRPASRFRVSFQRTHLISSRLLGHHFRSFTHFHETQAIQEQDDGFGKEHVGFCWFTAWYRVWSKHRPCSKRWQNKARLLSPVLVACSTLLETSVTVSLTEYYELCWSLRPRQGVIGMRGCAVAM